ncbi:MAG: RNA 2',3'-cyclic phosphodiesterase [Gemmatimonadota bacterium]|nr:RNA 2',3'-cyclic phosphodiesterase [Gemmatimonadota bacterium]
MTASRDPSSDSARLFVAVRPPPDARAELALALAHVRDAGRAFRWVREGQLHLTLRFVGAVDRSLIGEVSQNLDLAVSPHHPFQLDIRGTGCFPGPRRPRVLWAGVESTPELLELQAAVEVAVRNAGCAPEDRPFLPHITVARIRPGSVVDEGVVADLDSTRLAIRVPVREVALMESTLSPAGARHRALRVCPLGRGSGGVVTPR